MSKPPGPGLADLGALLAPTTAAVGGRPVSVRLETAVVSAVSATGGEDGQPLLTVTWRDTSVDAAHVTLPGATPWATGNVGAVVLVAVIGSRVVVLGVLQGTPPT